MDPNAPNNGGWNGAGGGGHGGRRRDGGGGGRDQGGYGGAPKRVRRGVGSTKKCKHRANDVIVEGLENMLNELCVKMAKQPTVLQHKSLSLKRAIASIRKYPLPLRRTYDMQLLKYVGEKTVGYILKILHESGEAVDTSYGARLAREAAAAAAAGPGGGDKAGVAGRGSSTGAAPAAAPAAASARAYCPKFGQAPWAFMCAHAQLSAAAGGREGAEAEDAGVPSQTVGQAAGELLALVVTSGGGGGGGAAPRRNVNWTQVAKDLEARGLVEPAPSAAATERSAVAPSAAGHAAQAKLLRDPRMAELLPLFQQTSVVLASVVPPRATAGAGGGGHGAGGRADRSPTPAGQVRPHCHSDHQHQFHPAAVDCTAIHPDIRGDAASRHRGGGAGGVVRPRVGMSLAARLASFSPTQDYVPHSSQFESPVGTTGQRHGASSRGSSSRSHMEVGENNEQYFRKLSRSPDVKTRVVLLVDTREQHNSNHQFFWSRLLQNRVDCEKRALAVGDMMWVLQVTSHRRRVHEFVLDFIVERKIISDLRQSIIDGRYVEQKARIRRCGISRKIYLVEGAMVSSGHISAETLHASLVKTQLNGFLVKRTDNTEASIEFLSQMHRNIVNLYATQPGKCFTNPRLKFGELHEKATKNQRLTVRDLFKWQLSQLPGVGTERAIAVVARFHTARRLYDFCKLPACTSAGGRGGGGGDADAAGAARDLIRKQKIQELGRLRVQTTGRQIGPQAALSVFENYS